VTDADEMTVEEFTAWLKKRRAELFFGKPGQSARVRTPTGDFSSSVRAAMQRQRAAHKNPGHRVRGGRNPSV